MALEFKEDAICLSGFTGSKLKCEVIGQYYPFWWKITSGGQRAGHAYGTAIIELDAATGEVYIEDTGETVLGSSGHALELKLGNPNTANLRVVLVEKDPDCYRHLKRVIKRRWPLVDIDKAEGPTQSNSSGVFLLNKSLNDAVNDIIKMNLGNALFFFDPLRGTEYRMLETVAQARIRTFYKTGTEFIIFLFTSDWFLGRDNFSPLPISTDQGSWSEGNRRTVLEANTLFGTDNWRSRILTGDPVHSREEAMVALYKARLHRWFRYVLPMPFNPKLNQIFHLMLCSNYEAGVRETRDFFCDITGNAKFSPDNQTAYLRFCSVHPELSSGSSGTKRPLQWRILWKVISQHEDGICDRMCADFFDVSTSPDERQRLLYWLVEKDYLAPFNNAKAWNDPIPQYRLNWQIVTDRLGIKEPIPFKPLALKPLSMEDINR